MTITGEKVKKILEAKKLSLRELAKVINYSHGGLSNMLNGKIEFSPKVLNKIISAFELTREEFESWVLADKYPGEILKLAIQARKDFPYKRKSIVTTKIDTILLEKYMSRTALAKQINYSQSSLNKMIMGKRGFSKSVLEKTAAVLEISQDRLLGWIIADKYSLTVLEKAYSCLRNK